MPDPIWRQIAEALRQRIETGEFGHGSQLPTELELRDQYMASRNTVRDALKWLTSRGLIESRAGKGTFVVEKIDPFVTTLDAVTGFGGGEDATYASDIMAQSRKPTVSKPLVQIHQASSIVAEELELDEGALVVSRSQLRYIDETPWSKQTTYYPMRYVDGGARRLIEADDMPDGAVRYLEQTLGIKQVGWRDKITVRAPDSEEATFFNLPDDGRVAVFAVHRTAYESTMEPLRLSVTAYPADRNQFVMSFGRVPTSDTHAYHPEGTHSIEGEMAAD